MCLFNGRRAITAQIIYGIDFRAKTRDKTFEAMAAEILANIEETFDGEFRCVGKTDQPKDNG